MKWENLYIYPYSKPAFHYSTCFSMYFHNTFENFYWFTQLMITYARKWVDVCLLHFKSLNLKCISNNFFCIFETTNVLLLARFMTGKMFSGQFFREIIYQCLTRLNSNIHSLLALSINCNLWVGECNLKLHTIKF